MSSLSPIQPIETDSWVQVVRKDKRSRQFISSPLSRSPLQSTWRSPNIKKKNISRRSPVNESLSSPTIDERAENKVPNKTKKAIKPDVSSLTDNISRISLSCCNEYDGIRESNGRHRNSYAFLDSKDVNQKTLSENSKFKETAKQNLNVRFQSALTHSDIGEITKSPSMKPRVDSKFFRRGTPYVKAQKSKDSNA